MKAPVDKWFIFECGNFTLSQITAHVVGDTLVVEHTLNVSKGTDGKLFVPQLLLGKFHDILGGELSNGAFDVFGAQATAGGDDLAANIFGNGGGTIERQEDGGLQLSLGALNLGFSDIERQARPFTESEVDEVVKLSEVLAYKVDTPETT
jgi:hypothetical protein